MNTAFVIAAALGMAASVAVEGDRFVLVLEDLTTREIRLGELTRDKLFDIDETEGWNDYPLVSCVAIFDAAGLGAPYSNGMVELVDGQRLPGSAAAVAPRSDVVVWDHDSFGRLEIDLARVSSIRLTPDAPNVIPGDEDVVVLTNGDRQEGLIVAFGDPIHLEVSGENGVSVVKVPLERAAAVAMVNPPREATGRRIWLREGTVIDVSRLWLKSDGYMRITTDWLPKDMQPYSVRIEVIAAVLFDSRAMVPLAGMNRWRSAGPETRYIVPPPMQLDQQTPLGLSRIALRGPITVQYVMPDDAKRFAVKATLPPASRRWGDFEFIVRDDSRIVFQQRLNAETPTAEVNVEVRGTELTLEMTEGRYGPIQDVLILERAMVSR